MLPRNVVIRMSVSINEAEVRRWLREAQPGEAIDYFRGFLGRGANACGEMLAERERRELSRVAECLWWAAQHNRVHLVQRRHGAEDSTYVAIAREHPHHQP
jgi:hypothetical protein